jgi:hypothetical protein
MTCVGQEALVGAHVRKWIDALQVVEDNQDEGHDDRDATAEEEVQHPTGTEESWNKYI